MECINGLYAYPTQFLWGLSLMSVKQWHYFVGDIHGCYRELMALEAKIARHAARHGVQPMVVSVGDLVDRGPGSMEVVRHFRSGVEAGTHAVIMGNHEALMLAAVWECAPWDVSKVGFFPKVLATIDEDSKRTQGFARALNNEDYRLFRRFMWLGQGGYDTLQSFGCCPQDAATWRFEPEDLSFLINLPFMWENEHFVVTHAFATQKQLACLRKYHMKRKSCVYPHAVDAGEMSTVREAIAKVLWYRRPPSHPPDVGRIHISGHTPVARVKRYKKRNLIQIDTACVYGKRLTALCGESDELLNVQGRTHAF